MWGSEYTIFIIMWLKKRTVKLPDFLWIPVIYVISSLPAYLFGRDFKELMTVYFEQTNTYPWGTLEYPNIYAIQKKTRIYNVALAPVCAIQNNGGR